jgi:hypothetical protein
LCVFSGGIRSLQSPLAIWLAFWALEDVRVLACKADVGDVLDRGEGAFCREGLYWVFWSFIGLRGRVVYVGREVVMVRWQLHYILRFGGCKGCEGVVLGGGRFRFGAS